MHGGVPNREFNENNNQCILDKELSSILNELESNRGLLDNPGNIKYIISLLEAGADQNIRNQNGKTLSDYFNEKSFNILNELESDKSLLNGFNYTQYIMFLLETGANPDIQNKNKEILSDYLNKKLFDILNELESDRSLLNDFNYTQYIMFLLETGANPNIQNQNGKTLLHYVAECNDTYGISFFLKKGANPNVQDKDEKTPLHYAAKNNFPQAIELLLKEKADQNAKDKSGKTPFQYVTEHECRQVLKEWGYDLDDSHENEGNPATPDGSVGESNDCSNSSGDNSQVKSVKLSDCNTEEGSRENEENPAKSPDNGNRTFTDQQTSLERPVVSNSPDSDRDSEDSSDCGDKDILSQRDKNISRLDNLAYESIVNKDNKQIHEYDFKAEIDNVYFYVKYPQDSIIEPVKILNNEKAKKLNLKVGILQIGESIVRVESIDGKRNYTDILKGSIEMSFTTEVGEISIYLSPSKKDGNKIEVEIDKESEARLNELKAKKKSLGENCLLGGKSVLEAIEDKGFEKNGNVPTESIETTKDVSFTGLTQACSQKIDISGKSKQ
ncbi:ankyrin repeat domain-containing protein [Wolbachia endosymbiont (group A) of Agelastica alni]|uniref:ankyrin repeat domain-containing protein n=1 Tax=Wolbachia endosymbiont (group A) of Agelastica alni TaxID=3066130 RepID=UPI0031333DB4